MLRLFGEELMGLVPLLELHRFVADAQRAHVELAEVFVGRRVRDCKLGEQDDAREHIRLYPRLARYTTFLHAAARKGAMTGSNRRHPPCKGGALPAELIAHARLRRNPSADPVSFTSRSAGLLWEV